MVVAIASGKGGTGKTTVATNLAVTARDVGRHVRLLDCDVEEPNCHLFIQPTVAHRTGVTVPVPVVDAAKCNHCGDCGRLCAFGAIVCLKDEVIVFPELCHSCGGCALVCPERAIVERRREVGEIEEGNAQGLAFRHGRLNVGEARAVPVISAVKEPVAGDGIVLIDAPPGASCPMIAAVRGSDFVCLVAEPTPFGLNDLGIVVEAVWKLGMPMGVIINRSDIGDDRVRQYCEERRIPVLMELGDDRRIAGACSRGEVVVQVLPQYRDRFLDLLGRIERQVGGDRRDERPCGAMDRRR